MAGKRNYLSWLFTAMAGLLLVTSLLLGAKISPLCYGGMAGLAPLAIAARRLDGKRKDRLQRAELRRGWAREDGRDRPYGRLERSFYLISDAAGREKNCLDEDTWVDLNMDGVYGKIDRTLTLPGETMLYAWLRSPELQEPPLLKRNELIRLFQNNEPLRESVRLELSRLGRIKSADITDLLWGQPAPKPAISVFFLPLTLLAVAAFLSIPLYAISAIMFGVLPVFLVNLMITHWFVPRRICFQINALRYLGAMIGRARNIASLNHPELRRTAAELNELAGKVMHIARSTRLLRPERGMSIEIADVLYEYVNCMFLIEVRTFFKIQIELARHVQPLRRLYELLGGLDACHSVASFRAQLSSYAEPQFASGVCLDIQSACHPLLAQPVPNSIAPACRGVFITGSNMSGKSTFLRSIAINAILAQSVYTCCATGYRACFFRVLSSINHADELDEGKSYYLIEAERLLRIVRAVDGEAPCLCVIDELLKGTNAAERASASAAILDYLSGRNALVFVASHDTDLASTVSDGLEHYHFTDRLEDGRLEFDYRLQPGRARTRNAISLLQSLGYPAQITDLARQRFGERL